MLYGKIINDKLVYAPEKYTFSNGLTITNFNNDTALLSELGYKEIEKDLTPIDVRFEYIEKYKITEENKIFVYYELDNSVQILDDLKEKRIKRTKEDLAIYLQENPLKSDVKHGKSKFYTVTMEKQNQLFAKMNDYFSKALPKILLNEDVSDIFITWNAQGETSELWTYEEICKLKDEIMEYVNPIVEYQRYLEALINEQDTQDGIYNLDCTFYKDKIDNFVKNIVD